MMARHHQVAQIFREISDTNIAKRKDRTRELAVEGKAHK